MRWQDGFCADEVYTVDGRAMKVGDRHVRSIWLESDGWSVSAIDQRRLPHDFAVARLTTCDATADAIRSMLVRGAPLIGATAAYGMALAMWQTLPMQHSIRPTRRWWRRVRPRST